MSLWMASTPLAEAHPAVVLKFYRFAQDRTRMVNYTSLTKP